MTIDFSNDATLIGRIKTADAEYPQGTYRDKTAPSANDGTPSDREKERRDFDGFRQALVALGKITPDGFPDTAANSQILMALKTWYGGIFRIADAGSTSATILTRPRSQFDSSQVKNSKGDGSAYSLHSSLRQGGVEFSGTTPGDGTPTMRREYYDISASDISTYDTDTHILYNPSGGFTLTGIPQGAPIQGCGIETRSAPSGGTLQNSPVATSMDMSGTWPVVQTARGSWAGTSSIPSSVCRFWVDYDPSTVD